MSKPDLRLRDSVVYFAQREDGAIKIGTTTELAPRIKRLRSSQLPLKIELIGTLPGGYWLEAQLHRRLATHRLIGEWFLPAADVLAAARGELIQGDDTDPFNLATEATGPQTLDKGSRAMQHRRQQIIDCWRSGMTGREAATLLQMSTTKLRREVVLMSALGYFSRTTRRITGSHQVRVPLRFPAGRP